MTKYKTIEETNTQIWHLIRHLSTFHPTVEKYEELQYLIDDLYTLHKKEVDDIYEGVRLFKLKITHNHNNNINMLDELFEVKS